MGCERTNVRWLVAWDMTQAAADREVAKKKAAAEKAAAEKAASEKTAGEKAQPRKSDKPEPAEAK